MAKILISRYDLFVNRKMLTHFTTNLTGNEMEEYYGIRVPILKKPLSTVFSCPNMPEVLLKLPKQFSKSRIQHYKKYILTMTIDELNKILSKGEDVHTEYKQSRSKAPDNLYESVCAFLNREGGIVILGADDVGKVTGIDAACIEQIKKDIQISTWNTHIYEKIILPV